MYVGHGLCRTHQVCTRAYTHHECVVGVGWCVGCGVWGVGCGVWDKMDWDGVVRFGAVGVAWGEVLWWPFDIELKFQIQSQQM